MEQGNNAGYDHHFRARLANVASSLEAFGLSAEAGLAYTLYLVQDLPGQCSVGGGAMSERQLLSVLCSQSNGVLLPATQTQAAGDNQTKSAVRRLVEVFNSLSSATSPDVAPNRSTDSPAALDTAAALFLLIDRLRTGTSLAELRVSSEGQLSCTIGHVIVAVLKGRENLDVFGSLLLMTDILRQFGKSLQNVASSSNNAAGTPNMASAIFNYKNLVSSTANLAKSSNGYTPKISQMATAIIYVLASTFLIPTDTLLRGDPNQFSSDETLRGLALDLVEESTKILSSIENEPTISLQPLQFSTTLYRFMLGKCSRTNSIEITLAEIVGLAKRTTENFLEDGIVREDYQRMGSDCLLWAMNNLQRYLERKGDKVLTSRVSHWMYLLSNNHGPAIENWFHSSWISQCVDERSNPCNQYLSAQDLLIEYQNMSEVLADENWLTHFELVLSHKRLRANYRSESCRMSERDYECQVEAKLIDLAGVIPPDEPRLYLMHSWLMSTLKLAMSEDAMSAGDFPLALENIQHCMKSAQAIMRTSRPTPGVEDSKNLLSQLVDGLVSRAHKRYTDCLIRKVILYCSVGDHRKAAAYTRSLADVGGIDVKSKDYSDLLSDLGGLMLHANDISTGDRTELLRFVLEVRCLGGVHHDISDAFSRIDPYTLSGTSMSKSEISVQLESFKNLLCGRSFCGAPRGPKSDGDLSYILSRRFFVCFSW